MLEYGDRSDGACCSFVSNALHNDPLWKKRSALYHKHAVGMMESSKRVRELHSRVEDVKIHPSSLEDMKLLLKGFVELGAQVRPGFLAGVATKAKMLLSELVQVIGATTERTLTTCRLKRGCCRRLGKLGQRTRRSRRAWRRRSARSARWWPSRGTLRCSACAS